MNTIKMLMTMKTTTAMLKKIIFMMIAKWKRIMVMVMIMIATAIVLEMAMNDDKRTIIVWS